MLTPVQRRFLTRYRDHREKPFTFLGLARSFFVPTVLSVALVAVCVVLMPPPFSLFVAGVLLGVLLRNLALIVHGLRVMPVLLQVLDWKAVDHLLDEPEVSVDDTLPRVR